MLGEGGTNGNPVWSQYWDRRQPLQRMMESSQLNCSVSFRYCANSPAVIPWRFGNANIPTKDRNRLPTRFPSTSIPPIGSVQNVKRNSHLGRNLHRKRHRVEIGVVATAHVLNVEHQGVQTLEPLPFRRKRFGGASVKAEHG